MKWAIREAVDVYFKAKSRFKLGARTIRAGEPVLIFDTVQTSTMEVAAEIAYVTGGRGNARILSFEGDKTLTFNFEDALLSNEGLAILSGADLIPARNPLLPGASPEARQVIAHYTEKYAVITNNIADENVGPGGNNTFPVDPSIPPNGGVPRGGVLNVWLTRKPFVGQNASIYVMLLDNAGEMSGAPIEINLQNNQGLLPRVRSGYSPYGIGSIVSLTSNSADPITTVWRAVEAIPAPATGADPNDAPDAAGNDSWVQLGGTTPATSFVNPFNVDDTHSYLSKFRPGDYFIAVGRDGRPIPKEALEGQVTEIADPTTRDLAAIMDDQTVHYVDAASMGRFWVDSWGDNPAPIDAQGIQAPVNPANPYVRIVSATTFGASWGAGVTANTCYGWLLAPSGGIAQPKAHKEGNQYFYKVNVPSILFQDILLLDYYVAYDRNATQVSILPDKFGPFMYVEGSSLVRRASDGMDLPAQFVIPKFKITTALTFTMAATGDPSTFNFQGDAYPDFSKFDLTRRVLADIQVLDADDNFDQGFQGAPMDPTSYRRFHYTDNDGEYLWKDPSMQPHANIDYADPNYVPTEGGPITRTPGEGGLLG